MCGSISKRQRQSHQRDQEKQLLLASPTPSTPAPTPIRTTSPPPYSQVDRQTTPVDVGSYNLKRDKSSSTTGRPVSRILSPAFQAELCPPQIYAQPTECIANGHIRKRKYGTKGIIAGIVFFPWGLFWTRCDSSVVCKRCGTTLEHKGCNSYREDKFALDG